MNSNGGVLPEGGKSIKAPYIYVKKIDREEILALAYIPVQQPGVE